MRWKLSEMYDAKRFEHGIKLRSFRDLAIKYNIIQLPPVVGRTNPFRQIRFFVAQWLIRRISVPPSCAKLPRNLVCVCIGRWDVIRRYTNFEKFSLKSLCVRCPYASVLIRGTNFFAYLRSCEYKLFIMENSRLEFNQKFERCVVGVEFHRNP